MMSKRPTASSSRWSSARTTSYPSSSAAQSTAINQGTRLPAGLTVRAGSSASTTGRLQSPAPVLPSYLRPTFTIAPGTRSSSSSAIRHQHNPFLLRSQSLSLPRYANDGSVGQQSAGTGRTTTWPPCPWTTSSSFSNYYNPTPKSHSQPSVDDDVMTCSSFASSSTRAWTMLEDDSRSTKSSAPPSFYDDDGEQPWGTEQLLRECSGCLDDKEKPWATNKQLLQECSSGDRRWKQDSARNNSSSSSQQRGKGATTAGCLREHGVVRPSAGGACRRPSRLSPATAPAATRCYEEEHVTIPRLSQPRFPRICRFVHPFRFRSGRAKYSKGNYADERCIPAVASYYVLGLRGELLT